LVQSVPNLKKRSINPGDGNLRWNLKAYYTGHDRATCRSIFACR